MISGVYLLFLPLLVHLAQVARWAIGMRGALLTPEPPLQQDHLPLTVVLPVRNEVNTLPRLLADLSSQTLLPRRVIVVDDASEDGTAAAIKSRNPWPFPIAVMPNPGQGKKAGLSAGIRACTTEWAIGVDGDTRLGRQTLEAIAHRLSRHGPNWDMVLLPLAYRATLLGEINHWPGPLAWWLCFLVRFGVATTCCATCDCSRLLDANCAAPLRRS